VIRQATDPYAVNNLHFKTATRRLAAVAEDEGYSEAYKKQIQRFA